MSPVEPRVSVTWSDAARQILRLTFLSDAQLPPPAVANLRRVIEAFARVGSRGGFARAGSPSHSADIRVAPDRSPSPYGIVFELETLHFDRSALQLLRNIAVSLNADVVPIAELAIDDITPNERPSVLKLEPITWGNAGRVYPAQVPALSFSVHRSEPSDYRKGRRCQIDLARSVDAQVLGRLADSVRDWAIVVESDGFAPPVKPASEACVTVDTLGPFDDSAVEVFFTVFDVAEECWRVLHNVLEHFARKECPVALVTID
ncbi:MAG: hypothetical protein HY613_08320 [Candidatus Rokubacteria bacterium]|nr:hypothetical protein [Candidatus Rokubacteria bacterium]